MSDRRTESTLVKDLKNFSRACHPERSEAPAEGSEGPLHFLDSTLGVACPGPNVRAGVSLPRAFEGRGLSPVSAGPNRSRNGKHDKIFPVYPSLSTGSVPRGTFVTTHTYVSAETLRPRPSTPRLPSLLKSHRTPPPTLLWAHFPERSSTSTWTLSSCRWRSCSIPR